MKEGREDVPGCLKKWAAKNAKDRCKCGESTNLGTLRLKIGCDTYTRRIEYE
jgi:hypothetical protein